jgi:hypothetical protein
MITLHLVVRVDWGLSRMASFPIAIRREVNWGLLKGARRRICIVGDM